MSAFHEIDNLLAEFESSLRPGARKELHAYLERCPPGTSMSSWVWLLTETAIVATADFAQPAWIDDLMCQALFDHRTNLATCLTSLLYGNGDDERELAHKLRFDRLGQFRLTAIRGFGAFGTTFDSASDGDPQPRFIVKVAHRSTGAIARLVKECQGLSRLAGFNCSGVPRLVDHNLDGPVAWLAYHRLEGVPLSEWLATHPAEHRRLDVCERIAELRTFLDGKDIVHGDHSPENILVDDARDAPNIAFVDFAESTWRAATPETQVVATHLYAAPEILMGSATQATQSADAWSIAVLIYQILVGHHPFLRDAHDRPALDELIQRLKGSPLVSLPTLYGTELHTSLLRSLECNSTRRRLTADLVSAIRQARHAPGFQAINHAETLMRDYAGRLIATHGVLRPALVRSPEEAVIRVDQLFVDLPLTVERDVDEFLVRKEGLDESFAQRVRLATSQAAAIRSSDTKRETASVLLESHLQRQKSAILIGAPGSGKSTLIAQQICELARPLTEAAKSRVPADFDRLPPSAPAKPLVPVVVIARSLSSTDVLSLESIVRSSVASMNFLGTELDALTEYLVRKVVTGRAVVFVDGLDEMPVLADRQELMKVLREPALRAARPVIVASTRPVGFETVRHLVEDMDWLAVDDLKEPTQDSVIRKWAEYFGWSDTDARVKTLLDNPRIARLRENVMMLTLLIQLFDADQALPNRRVDVIQRLVAVMLERQRRIPGQELVNANEVTVHLETLAYAMRSSKTPQLGVPITEVSDLFKAARAAEAPDDVAEYAKRPVTELIGALIQQVGLLHIVGRKVDKRGIERDHIRFVHQLFEEYFTAQAILHGRGGDGRTPEAMLVDFLLHGESTERGAHTETIEVNGAELHEPMLAERWREVIQMAVARAGDLDEGFAALLLEAMARSTSNLPASYRRAEAVFLMDLLGDDPKLPATSIAAVTRAFAGALEDYDALTNNLLTSADRAIARAAASIHWAAVATSFLDCVKDASDETRRAVLNALALGLRKRDQAYSVPDIATLLDEARTYDDSRRTLLLLRLVNAFFADGTPWWTGDFPAEQRDRYCMQCLEIAQKSTGLDRDIAMWVCWWASGLSYVDDQTLVKLPSSLVDSIDHLMHSDGVGERGMSCCADLLAWADAMPSLKRDARGHDLVYEAAVVADGGKPQRVLHSALDEVLQRGRRPELAAELTGVFSKMMSPSARQSVARALIQIGDFNPRLSEPLRDVIHRTYLRDATRDHAFLGLVGCGADGLFFELAQNENDYVSGRGLFGMILRGNFDELCRGVLMSTGKYRDECALALAGLEDPRGLAWVMQQAESGPDDVRAICRKAIERSKKWSEKPAT